MTDYETVVVRNRRLYTTEASDTAQIYIQQQIEEIIESWGWGDEEEIDLTIIITKNNKIVRTFSLIAKSRKTDRKVKNSSYKYRFIFIPAPITRIIKKEAGEDAVADIELHSDRTAIMIIRAQ